MLSNFSFKIQKGLGPFAIVELMSGAASRRVMHQYHGQTTLNDTLLDNVLNEDITPSSIISTLTFMNGLVCVGFFKGLGKF